MWNSGYLVGYAVHGIASSIRSLAVCGVVTGSLDGRSGAVRRAGASPESQSRAFLSCGVFLCHGSGAAAIRVGSNEGLDMTEVNRARGDGEGLASCAYRDWLYA
jgi:hypothetical protein